jgi:choline-sulfatase
MNRRGNRLLGLLIVAGPFAVLALGLLFFRGRPPKTPEPIASGALRSANVLLITVDALRADHLGAYASGGSMSPGIDQFAKDGLYFERVYSHVPVARPSYRTLMTAAYPHHLDTTATLATQLKAAGYRTGAFVGSRDLDTSAGLTAGFDVYDDRMPGEGASRNAEQVFAAASDWLGSHGDRPPPGTARPAPWFAWIQLSDPNEPYRPPEPFRSKYAAEGYDGEVAYVDAAFLTFVTGLRRNGIFDGTLLVVTAPFGESLGEHGEHAHGTLAYDATLRVPLIMWGAPQIEPGVVRDPMRLVDLAPTIVDLLGVAPLSAVDGRSIRPFLGGTTPFDGRESYFEVNGVKGIVQGSRKLIMSGTPEYFDLAADPEEARNLYGPDDPNVRALETIIRRISP